MKGAHTTLFSNLLHLCNTTQDYEHTFFFIKHSEKTKHQCSTHSSKESTPIISHSKISGCYLNTEEYTYWKKNTFKIVHTEKKKSL